MSMLTEDENRRICGAGILPFFVTPDGRLLFMLARERFVAGWAGSSKLSAFEGGNKVVMGRGEDVTQNAVREFAEESISLFLDTDESYDALKQELSGRDFALRIGVSTEARSDVHWTFVKQFPFRNDFEKEFQRRRNFLDELQKIGKRMERLQHEIPTEHPFTREGQSIEHICGRATVVAIRNVSCRNMWMSIVRDERLDSTNEVQTRRFTYLRCDESNKFEEWWSLRERAKVIIRQLPETVIRHATKIETLDHEPVSIFVNSDWLEKDSVILYSLHDLKSICKSRIEQETFRPFFILVLKCVLEQFSTPSEAYSTVDRTY